LERRLAAILAADVVGYSRLMGGDETATLEALKACERDLIEPTVERHRGPIAKRLGDGFLVEFASAVDAVSCALEWQQAAAVMTSPIRFRIGVNLGDIIFRDSDIYGDGVNVAARLEGLAEAGGLCISAVVHDQVRRRIEARFRDLGNQILKNIEEPVRVVAWPPGQAEAAPPAAASAKPSIAVLPFNNLSGDPQQDYFADGIAEDIITDLSKVSGLLVIARNSSFAYKGSSPDVRQVCRDLDVGFVLEGSVRKAGNTVRINAQLIDGSTGGHLWAERYDRQLEDIFAVQDEVTRNIVTALQVALTADEHRRRQMPAKVDPEAYDCLVKARTYLHQFTAEGVAKARALLERAIAIDNGLAPAYAQLAIVHSLEYMNHWNDAGDDHLAAAFDLVDKALAADPDEPQAYHALALAHMWSRHLEEAERAGEKAIALDPNYAGAYAGLASAYTYAGRYERAIEVLHTALRLDPQYDLSLQFLGRAQFLLHRYDEAEVSFKRRLERAPRSDLTRAYLASLYGHTGRREEALAVWRELLEIKPDFSPEHLLRILPFKDPAWYAHFIDGLKRAGLEF
jgi:adenylate cyclase